MGPTASLPTFRTNDFYGESKKKITCLFFIEGVEWRVTEFRVITLTNHDTRRGSHEPIRTRLTPSTGSASEQIEICCGCNSNWLRKCREIFLANQKAEEYKTKVTSNVGHVLF